MKTLKLLSFVSILLSLTSCAPTIYFPTPQCVPLFGKSGEGEASVEAGSPFVNVQGAYALTNNFFVTGNATFNPQIGPSDDPQYRMFEFGGGFYTAANAPVRLEIQGGGGFGNYNISSSAPNDWFLVLPLGHDDYMVNTHYASWYIQPAIGRVNRNTEIGFSFRISSISFPRFFYEEKIYQPNTPVEVNIATQWAQAFFFQPYIYGSLGGPHFKGTAQFGFSLPPYTYIFNNNAYSLCCFTVGFQYRFLNY